MDPYAYQIFLASNSYGSNYSDNLLSAYDAEGGGPLISVSEPDGGNVGSIDMTLFGDSDTPSGYIDPVLYNYIDPGADGFDAVPAAASSTHGANVVLSLSNATTAFDQANATLTIEIKTGSGDSDFQSVTLTPDSGSDIWQNWSISSDGGSFTATGSGDQPDGSVLINLPTDVGSTHWYKITFATSTGGEVGTASAITSKTFNFYAKTGSNGQFLNPTASGQEGSIAIDGLGSYSVAANSSGQSTLPSVTLDFFANRNTLPSSLLTRDTSDFAINQLAQPEAPVVGLVTSGSFVADTDHTIDGTSVAFGWAGAGDLTNPSTYSNKIGALNVALVTVKDSGGTQVGTVSGTADLDGEWSTGDLDLSSFGAGSYTATMTEFLASDTSFSTPVGRTSAEIAFTLEASNLII